MSPPTQLSKRALAEDLEMFYGDFAFALAEAERKWFGIGDEFDPLLQRSELLMEHAFMVEDDVDDLNEEDE